MFGLRLKEGKFRLDVRKELFPVRVAQGAQSSLEQPGIVEGFPAHGRGWSRVSF